MHKAISLSAELAEIRNSIEGARFLADALATGGTSRGSLPCRRGALRCHPHDTLGTGRGVERRQPVLSDVVPLAAAPLARYRGHPLTAR
jgi:hypothetical protein